MAGKDSNPRKKDKDKGVSPKSPSPEHEDVVIVDGAEEKCQQLADQLKEAHEKLEEQKKQIARQQQMISEQLSQEAENESARLLEQQARETAEEQNKNYEEEVRCLREHNGYLSQQVCDFQSQQGAAGEQSQQQQATPQRHAAKAPPGPSPPPSPNKPSDDEDGKEPSDLKQSQSPPQEASRKVPKPLDFTLIVYNQDSGEVMFQTAESGLKCMPGGRTHTDTYETTSLSVLALGVINDTFSQLPAGMREQIRSIDDVAVTIRGPELEQRRVYVAFLLGTEELTQDGRVALPVPRRSNPGEGGPFGANWTDWQELLAHQQQGPEDEYRAMMQAWTNRVQQRQRRQASAGASSPHPAAGQQQHQGPWSPTWQRGQQPDSPLPPTQDVVMLAFYVAQDAEPPGLQSIVMRTQRLWFEGRQEPHEYHEMPHGPRVKAFATEEENLAASIRGILASSFADIQGAENYQMLMASVNTALKFPDTTTVTSTAQRELDGAEYQITVIGIEATKFTQHLQLSPDYASQTGARLSYLHPQSAIQFVEGACKEWGDALRLTMSNISGAIIQGHNQKKQEDAAAAAKLAEDMHRRKKPQGQCQCLYCTNKSEVYHKEVGFTTYEPWCASCRPSEYNLDGSGKPCCKCDCPGCKNARNNSDADSMKNFIRQHGGKEGGKRKPGGAVSRAGDDPMLGKGPSGAAGPAASARPAQQPQSSKAGKGAEWHHYASTGGSPSPERQSASPVPTNASLFPDPTSVHKADQSSATPATQRAGAQQFFPDYSAPMPQPPAGQPQQTDLGQQGFAGGPPTPGGTGAGAPSYRPYAGGRVPGPPPGRQQAGETGRIIPPGGGGGPNYPKPPNPNRPAYRPPEPPGARVQCEGCWDPGQ